MSKKADHLLATILGEKVYDPTYTTKDKDNPYAKDPAKLYTGVTVKGVTKVDPAAADGTVNEVALSNGVKIGFAANGEWTYADGNNTVLAESLWGFLPLQVQINDALNPKGGIRNSGQNITKIVKMERTAVAGEYTITFEVGTVKKFKADGTIL